MPRYSREYEAGYEDGYDDCIREQITTQRRQSRSSYERPTRTRSGRPMPKRRSAPKKARKLSAWQKYIKNKKNHIKMRNGKLNLKKMAVQYRKKKKR